MRQISGLLASAAIAASAAFIAAPAQAADDVGSNPITEFFDGLGLGNKEKPDIDYKERAPLVPPTSAANLPPPQAKTSARDAQWPNDPDVQARAERRAANDKVQTETYSYQMDRSPRVDPDELGRKRTAGAGVARTSADATRGDNQISRSSPEELAQRGTRDANPPTGERSRLTDPPAGYMVGNGVTASAQPEKKSWLGGLFGN